MGTPQFALEGNSSNSHKHGVSRENLHKVIFLACLEPRRQTRKQRRGREDEKKKKTIAVNAVFVFRLRQQPVRVIKVIMEFNKFC